MNYSLTGKARVAAKNTMRSKKAHCANIETYACREASRSPKTLAFAGTGVRGEMLCKWVKGHVNKPLMVA